ncbi:unnamed protein product [Effrenium voratum]|nr:unnamed protein product [Effrenium voratum]
MQPSEATAEGESENGKAKAEVSSESSSSGTEDSASSKEEASEARIIKSVRTIQEAESEDAAEDAESAKDATGDSEGAKDAARDAVSAKDMTGAVESAKDVNGPEQARLAGASPKASPSSPKAKTSPASKAKPRSAQEARSPKALTPPSPKAMGRRRSSQSLVPHELQKLQEGADFEAAKVRRAVAAAAKRVKAVQAKSKAEPPPKKKVTSRSELLACLFNALGGYETSYLSSSQLLRMALLLGFEGGQREWQREYLVLCRSYNWNPKRGANRRQFAALLDDDDSDAYSNDIEVATMLCNLQAKQPQQVPREQMVKEFFNWVDLSRSQRLGSRELLRFAKHVGFEGDKAAWEKEYSFMVRRYHWPPAGCDLAQFSRMLSDPEGLCYCDNAALQVELAELELATSRPFFSKLLDPGVQKAEAQLRLKSARLIQELWRGRLQSQVLMRELRRRLAEKKELEEFRKVEASQKARMVKAAARIWRWWRPYARKQKWMRIITATKARLSRESSYKEGLRTARLGKMSRLQDAEVCRDEDGPKPLLRASLLPPSEAQKRKVKSQQQRAKEIQESRRKAQQVQERTKRIASPKFLQADVQPRDWRHIRIPWQDNWADSVTGILSKQGLSSAQEGDRFEVLNCQGVPFSFKDRRLQSSTGRRPIVQADFPMLLNIKEWKLSELLKSLRHPEKEQRQAQVAIQKQIEMLKRGRPGKLMEPQERMKLERLRQEEANLKAKCEDAKAKLFWRLETRAATLLQAMARGLRIRVQERLRLKAAQAIQRGWRGYISRLRVEHLKELTKLRLKQVKHVRNAESLFEAVHHQQEAVAIRVIRDKDFNPFSFRHAVSQQSLLHAAAQEGLAALCGELLKAAKLRGMEGFASARDWRGWTALHTAALSDQAACCRELLVAEELSHPPGCLGRNNQTALHVAALQGHTEVAKVLLNTQSFEDAVDLRDRWGRTALHCAAEQGNATAIKIAEHVAFQSFEAKNAWGATAAQLAPEELRRALQDACKRRLQRLEGSRRKRRVCTYVPGDDDDEPEAQASRPVESQASQKSSLPAAAMAKDVKETHAKPEDNASGREAARGRSRAKTNGTLPGAFSPPSR